MKDRHRMSICSTMCKEKMTTCKILADVVFSAAFLTPPLSLFWRPQYLLAKVHGPTRNGMGGSNLKKRGGWDVLTCYLPARPACSLPRATARVHDRPTLPGTNRISKMQLTKKRNLVYRIREIHHAIHY